MSGTPSHAETTLGIRSTISIFETHAKKLSWQDPESRLNHRVIIFDDSRFPSDSCVIEVSFRPVTVADHNCSSGPGYAIRSVQYLLNEPGWAHT